MSDDRVASPPTVLYGPRPRRRRAVTTSLGILALATAVGTVTLVAQAVEPAIDLGTATSYSVLGSATVTNTGPTTLSGDLGVSPGEAITGFPPGIVGGATHAGDAAAAQARSDLTIAYNNAAGKASTAQKAGDLVGQTLTEGVYQSTGPLGLTGRLTLDGGGKADSVFIFQIADTLITGSSSEVLLTNGADACNVYWQVGSSATLGTNSDFVGTVMALQSVTVTTGTTVEGRALARNGAVTLDNNVFTEANCAPEPEPTPTPTPTPTDTASPSVTPTDTASPSVTPTDTASPTATATDTGSSSPSGSESPTDTATPSPSGSTGSGSGGGEGEGQGGGSGEGQGGGNGGGAGQGGGGAGQGGGGGNGAGSGGGDGSGDNLARTGAQTLLAPLAIGGLVLSMLGALAISRRRIPRHAR